jgi:hypothetical protein
MIDMSEMNEMSANLYLARFLRGEETEFHLVEDEIDITGIELEECVHGYDPRNHVGKHI